MSCTNTLSRTIQRQVRPYPKAEAATHFMNSDLNLMSPRKNKSGQKIDVNVVRTQTGICYSGNGGSCQYQNDPTQQGVCSSSSHHLAQQQEQRGYCIGMGNCLVCSQNMVPDIVYNSSLLQKTPCGLHVKPDNQQVNLLAYNHHNLVSENVKMMVDTCSNFYGGSQLQDQVYNNGSQGQIYNQVFPKN
jgi:hypothetical protein